MGTAEEQLERLRRDLFRPDPPTGTLERYEVLRERLGRVRGPDGPAPQQGLERSQEPGSGRGAAPPEPPWRSTGRRRTVPTAVSALLVAAAVAAAVLVTQGDRGGAAPLAPALAATDRARLERVLGPSDSPWGPPGAGRTVVDVLRSADLPQLRVWARREAIGWLQRGSGPVHREIGSDGSARRSAEPLSIVLRCGTDAAYSWTVRGIAPGSDEVRVLATGAADRCGRATVATATLPARARITAFDLLVPAGVGWTMAVVVPDRD